MPLHIYKASAGSGKTYTLTKEYLRQLLKPGTQVRNILAITFTNAATADMKRKIVEALAQLARGTYADWKDLAAPKETQARLQARAQEKLHEVLHQYQDFSIKTIDSFVQNIIKPFAFELSLPRNYTPQIEEAQMAQDITLAVLDHYGRKGFEKISLYIDQYLHKQEQDQKSLRIQDKICNVVELLFQEKSIEALESLENLHTDDFESIIRNIEQRLEQIQEEADRTLDKAKKIIAENGLQSGDFQQGSRGVYAWFCLEQADLKKFSAPTSTVTKSVAQGILKKESPCTGQLVEAYEKLTNLDFSSYFLLKEVQNAIYSVALLNHAREILRETEEKTAHIPISEFNQKIDKALSEEGNDFIFERCGTRYRNIFIDEFQDTSHLQWKNLRPLIENNLAQGNDCMIVGDAKQSLYRFRSADMEQFVNLCEGNDTPEVRINRLGSNWRSSRGIIAFNNKFYDFIRARFPLDEGLAETVYADHQQYFKNETALPQEDPEAVRILQVKNVDNEFAQQWYKKQILEIVKKHKPEDIAVLCRKNHHCKIISDFLVENGYKVSTPDSLNLVSHAGLNLIIASLEYMHFKHSFYKAKTFNLAWSLGLWNTDTACGTHRGSEAYAGAATPNAYEVFVNPATGKRFEQLASLNRHQADLYDTVEAVMRFWGMEQKTDQYLLCFMDQIPAQNLNHIPDLVEWWNRNAETTPVAAPQQNDSIRVMSIHKSKGLEFKVVLMPFISDINLHIDQLFWTGPGIVPPEIGLPNALVRYVNAMEKTAVADTMRHEKLLTELDNLNALYVATTRPCEKLYLLNKVPAKDSSGFNVNCAINLFVQENPGYLEYEEDGAVLENRAETTEAAADTPKTSTPVPTALPIESHRWRNRMQEASLSPLTTPEQEWGNFIHLTLSYIETDNPDKAERALRLALLSHPQFKGRMEEARKEIAQIWKHPLLAPYFSGSYIVKTEYPVTTGSQTFIPDRLLLKGNEAVILDYKTGEPSDLYPKQVRNYMDLLSRMGYTAKGYLVYLAPLKVEPV